MKVIAKTDNGYLVEATIDELANCAGYRSDRHAWRSAIHGFNMDRNSDSVLSLGTEIKVSVAFTYLETLHENERKVRQSADFLRGMADVIDKGLPTTMFPPDEPAKTEA